MRPRPAPTQEAPATKEMTEAPKSKISLIGYLSRGSESANLPRIEAFRRALRDLGHIEGRTYIIEYRFAAANYDRVPEIAVDLVPLKPDLIIAPGTGAVGAAKKAAGTML